MGFATSLPETAFGHCLTGAGRHLQGHDVDSSESDSESLTGSTTSSTSGRAASESGENLDSLLQRVPPSVSQWRASIMDGNPDFGIDPRRLSSILAIVRPVPDSVIVADPDSDDTGRSPSVTVGVALSWSKLAAAAKHLNSGKPLIKVPDVCGAAQLECPPESLPVSSQGVCSI